MKLKVLLVSLAMFALTLPGRPAGAQTLSLKLDDGLVTLDARNVTVDEILARWSDTTGLTIVSQNGHGSDVPVTLHLTGMPEPEALRLVLRDLSGYIMGERRDPKTGAITIDRLVILPDSAARPYTMPTPTNAAPAPSSRTPQSGVDGVPRELAPQVAPPSDDEI